jgi:hypothetical protein
MMFGSKKRSGVASRAHPGTVPLQFANVVRVDVFRETSSGETSDALQFYAVVGYGESDGSTMAEVRPLCATTASGYASAPCS